MQALLERSPQTRPLVLQQEGLPPIVSHNSETQTQKDIREIGVLQAQFDKVLGRKYEQKDTLQRSYNPVIDRWRVEKLREWDDEKGEQGYVNEIRVNLETNLKERFQVADNVIRYRIDGESLYSEHFPNEPFDKVLERGAEYRLKHGTPEPEREGFDGERGGFEKIRSIMTNPDTPIGTKITSFSPKGIVEDSSYDRNIVDEYELVEDESGKHVKLTRTMVDFEGKDYYEQALSIDPNYFDKYDGRPMDAWFLANPIEGFVPNLIDRQKGISSKAFDKIYESETLKKVIDYYVDRITDEEVNWKEIALAFNAFLNQADQEERFVLGGGHIERGVFESSKSIQDTISDLGFRKPQDRGGAGCPTSKGYSMSNGSDFYTFGSVSSFSSGGGGSKEWFNCPKCHYKANGPVGDTCPGCSLTKQQYKKGKSDKEVC